MGHARRLVVVLVAACCLCATPGASAQPGGAAPVAGSSGAAEIVVSPGESIQDAVDRAAPGDTVVLSAGEYTQSVVVDRTITVRAREGAVLDGAGEREYGFVVTAPDVRIVGPTIERFVDAGVRAEARNLTVEDARVSVDGYGVELAEGAESARIVGSGITDNGGAGIAAFVPGVSLTVRDTVVENNGGNRYERAAIDEGDGIHVQHAASVRMANVSLVGNEDHGLSLPSTDRVDGQRVELRNVTARVNGDSGVAIEGTPGDDEVGLTGVRLGQNGAYGGWVVAEETRGSGVVASDNGCAGLYLEGGGDETRVSVEDAVFGTNGQEYCADQNGGLAVNAVGTVEASNVSARGNAAEGINVYGGENVLGREARLTNVTSVANGRGGVVVAGTPDSDEVTLREVTSRENEGTGVWTAAQRVRAVGVTALGNGETGMYVGGQTAGARVVLEDTRLESGGNHGLHVQHGRRVAVSDLSATGNGGHGVYVEGTENVVGQSVSLNRTDARGNSFSGARIEGTAGQDSAAIVAGSYSENGDLGVSVGAEEVTVRNATATGNEESGVWIRGSTDVTIRGARLASNGKAGVWFEPFGGRATVTRSVLTGNGDGEVVNRDGGTVRAPRNWWGEDGITDNDCVGPTECVEPLSGDPSGGTGDTTSPTPAGTGSSGGAPLPSLPIPEVITLLLLLAGAAVLRYGPVDIASLIGGGSESSGSGRDEPATVTQGSGGGSNEPTTVTQGSGGPSNTRKQPGGSTGGADETDVFSGGSADNGSETEIFTPSCPHCGAELPPQSQVSYCPNCGKEP